MLGLLGNWTLDLTVHQFGFVGLNLAFVAFRRVYNALATGRATILFGIEGLNLFLKFFVFTFKDACMSFSRKFREFEWAEIWVGEILFWKDFFFVYLRDINFTFLMIASIQISGLGGELIWSYSSNFNLFSPPFSRPPELCFKRETCQIVVIRWSKPSCVQSFPVFVFVILHWYHVLIIWKGSAWLFLWFFQDPFRVLGSCWVKWRVVVIIFCINSILFSFYNAGWIRFVQHLRLIIDSVALSNIIHREVRELRLVVLLEWIITFRTDWLTPLGKWVGNRLQNNVLSFCTFDCLVHWSDVKFFVLLPFILEAAEVVH